MAPTKRLSKQSADHLASAQRQRSLSSTSEHSSLARQDLSTSPSSRQRSKHSSRSISRDLVATQADLEALSPEQAGLESPRRGSASTMRTSSGPFEGPLTYTPTTHRISKAKKGKRVHACEAPGCGKVFTRAEHKRRHELNHNPEATFSCNRPGCRKAFHRIDLLQRHQERHDIEASGAEASSHRHVSSVAIAQEPPVSMASASMGPQHTTSTTPRHQPGAVPIPSLMNPQDRGDHMPVFSTADGSFDGYGNRTTGPFLDYSEGYESSHSTISDNYGRTYARGSVSSLSSPFEPTFNPSMVSTSGGWMMPVPPVLPSIMFEDGKSALSPSGADTSIPNGLSFSDVDAFEWTIIRRDLSAVPGLVRDDDGTGIFDTVRWQSCLECYWQFFHPFFPIIHRPTFFTTKPSPLLAGAMVAIGSQYDHRQDAKLYSMTLLETATRLLQRRENINNRSRLSDLQTILLLEVLSKYCSRRIEAQISPRFRYLYASLDQARYGLMPNPLALLRTASTSQNSDEIAKAHKFWIEQETRRRILQACFVVDTQQALLFEQPTALIQHTLPHLHTKDLKSTAPFPCDDDIWEGSPVEKWAEQARNFEYTDLPGAAADLSSESPRKLDFYQSRLLLSHILSLPTQTTALEQAMNAIRRNTHSSGSLSTEINYLASMIAKTTPIRNLLIVSGESWLLGRKVDNKADFQDAKQSLRIWVERAENSMTALWHSTQLLRTLVEPEDLATGERERATRFRDTHMLHENWVVYLATLVCWAHGFYASLSVSGTGVTSSTVSTFGESHSQTSSASTSTNSTTHPTLMDPAEADAEMREYLQETKVDGPENLRILNPRSLSSTHGLLETIRARKIAGSLGGLMNEAERVLYRLVEGRSRLSHF